MRGLFQIGALLTLLPATYGETALDAIRQLPKEQAARIARIEARGGTPEPERWYILTQDPTAENGVHEYVVSKGEIVASRSVSQFAESLKLDDILDAQLLKIDSDKAAKLAHNYAEANGVAVTGVNYELKKDGPDTAPAWTISCVDDKGGKVGAVVMTAGKGNVISHEGFALEPPPAATPQGVARKREAPRFDTYAKPEVAPATLPLVTSSVENDDADARRRKRLAKKPENQIARTFQNVGRTLEKFNPF